MLRERGQFSGALLHDRMSADGVSGHHHILRDVFFIFLRFRHNPLAGVHDTLGVGHTRAHLHDKGGVKFLGKLKSPFYEMVRLSGIRRLQHRNLCRDGVMTGILLILGGVHPRVVRHADDHPRVHSGVGTGVQRIRRHIQSHVLHTAEAAFSRQGSSKSHFHGHLLIGRPLAVNLIVLCRFLRDFRAGRSRIAGRDAASRLVEPPGESLVA